MKSSSKSTDEKSSSNEHAASLIRSKIQKLYAKEPSAKQELADAEKLDRQPTKHESYMHELSTSGKSLADIQTAWHNYYQGLSDEEKHEVWNEFYRKHGGRERANSSAPKTVQEPVHQSHTAYATQYTTTQQHRPRKHTSKHAHNLKSLLFGLTTGVIVLVILLFGFFNERFIAPFITPSKSVSNSSIIIDPGTTAVTNEAKIIIPKINAELPVVYDEKSIDEKAIQNALERGVIHYATTPLPGEKGNGAIFGHSSNNILNQGKYKFAFVLLRQLENGDTFIIQKDGKRYVYRVYEKKVVQPTDFSVLGANSKPATFTLITCDPPGTSINRLVVVGEQISPDPNQNTASSVPTTTTTTTGILPSNAPSLWQRLTSWLSS